MSARTRRWWTMGLLVVLAVGFTVSLAFGRIGQWRGSPGWQLVYELFGAFLALEVAAFALSRFGLERKRLPLFIGLAYLGAAVADVVAALVGLGLFVTPLAGQSVAVMSVWTAGRLSLALLLLVGLAAPGTAASARAELVPAAIIGVCGVFALVQAATMFGAAQRFWQWLIAGLLLAALPGYGRLYWRQGGSLVASVLISLMIGLFAQVYMARSAVLYDGAFNVASVLRVASYLPLLAGLFVESVTLFRAERRLQAELSEYSRGLETKVAERTRALESRAKDLESFAYTVSHDLKAPLRGVQTYSQSLLDAHSGQLDGEGQRCATNAVKAATQMKQLIDDLLEYSRLERRELELAPVDLRSLVASVIEERQTDIQQAGVKIEVDLPTPIVNADRTMLRQVLANLVDNAIKFSRRAASPRVVVRGREANGEYIVSVQDNGIGFDMQHHDRIFEAFHRLHRADEIEGTGLGLSIVKRAIEKHGGRVRAESARGQGATFTFTLPSKS